MRPEHKRWADYVVSGKQPTEAYLLVFPKASKKTAANQIGTFKKNVGLMGYVQDQLDKIAAKVEQKVTEKLSNIEVGNVLTSARKREILNLIASGELEQEKMVLVKDPESGKMVWRKILIKPDLHDRMKAIDLDNKMTGDAFRAKSPDLINPLSDTSSDAIFQNTTFIFKTKD